MSAHVPGRTWLNRHQRGGPTRGQALVVEATESGDVFAAEVWVAVDGDGAAVQLSAKQCREVAAELVKRADLIDPGLIDAEIMEEVEA